MTQEGLKECIFMTEVKSADFVSKKTLNSLYTAWGRFAEMGNPWGEDYSGPDPAEDEPDVEDGINGADDDEGFGAGVNVE